MTSSNPYKILHLDSNHPLLLDQLNKAGYINEIDYTSTKEEVKQKIHDYDGIVLRSRFKIDADFLNHAQQLKFIARVGAGLENIDGTVAALRNIRLIAAPEGNRTAVGEHALGMLLSLMNRLQIADHEVRNGIWNRESNRGIEIEGKTVGIIGYGNMGKAFAQRLQGFNCKVIFYDLLEGIGNEHAKQVSLEELQQQATILSLHTPETPETVHLINSEFLQNMKNPFWFVNTARGKSVCTSDLVASLKSGKVLGAALDVLEYEKSSFENFFQDQELPEPLQYLIQANNVLLTPHIAGWTMESKEKLAQIIVNRIISYLDTK